MTTVQENRHLRLLAVRILALKIRTRANPNSAVRSLEVIGSLCGWGRHWVIPPSIHSSSVIP